MTPGTARRYDFARALPPATVDAYMNELKRLLPAGSVRRILDLGCGTGRFVPALLSAFGSPVIALDPSQAMLDHREREADEDVDWICGSAEDICLSDNTVDLVWMCQVFHHLDDAQRAFQEIHRVSNRPGHLAIRNGTRENDSEVEWWKCFPEAQEIDEERIPSQRAVRELVSGQGFDIVAQRTFYQYFAPSYQKYYDKIAGRGLSALLLISDSAFHDGLKRLRQWVAKQPADQPVYEPVDLFLFRAKR